MDINTLPVRADLQDVFRVYMPRLVHAFGLEPSALAPRLQDLSTTDKLIAATSMLNMAPLFRAVYNLPDGSQMRQITIALEMMTSSDDEGNPVLIGMALKMHFFHPAFGEPRVLGSIVIAYDEVAVSMLGATLFTKSDDEAEYQPGEITKLLSIIPTDGSGDLATLFKGMVTSLVLENGSKSDTARDGILSEVEPFIQNATGQTPAPVPTAEEQQKELSEPIDADLVLVLPELLNMADKALENDPSDDESLTGLFYALMSELAESEEPLTPLRLVEILDDYDHLQILLNKDTSSGKIISAAIAFDLTDDNGDLIDRFALGVASDVAMPAAFNITGLSLIVGDIDDTVFDPKSFGVFAKPSATLSAEKAKANREMVLRALAAMHTFTADDAAVEAVRRQAYRLLNTVPLD